MSKHTFCFNEDFNGGESLTLDTEISCGVVINQQLTLMSYSNSSTFNLSGSPLTPELLRKLADELDSAIAKCDQK